MAATVALVAGGMDAWKRELNRALMDLLDEVFTYVRQRPISALTFGYLTYFSTSVTWNCILQPTWRKLEAARTAVAIPNPSPSIFWGHFLDVFVKNRERVPERLWEFFREGQKTVQLATPIFDRTPIWINTIDARNVKHILQDKHDNYIKSDVITKMPPKLLAPGGTLLLGRGIFAIDHGPHAIDGGKNWRLQRKIAVQIFTKSNFQTHMGDCFQRQAQNACEWISQNGSRPVDLQEVFRRFTMESIGNVFFSTDFGLLDGNIADGVRNFGTCFDEANAALVKLRDSSTLFYSFSDFCPAPFDRIVSLWYWSGRQRRDFVAKCEELRSHARKIVETARADHKLSQRRDLLGLFMQQEGTAFDDDMLIDLVLSFSLAGRDTTASLLSWSAALLCQAPAVQAKLRDEVIAHVGATGTASFRVVDKMPYLKALLWEVLRLKPVVPLDSKNAVEADVLPDGTYVPRNARVFFFPYGVGQDKERWGNDVSEFKPERWMGKPLPSNFDFPVFQAGPRICLGMNMSLFEAGVMLVNLVQRFELLPRDCESTAEFEHDENIVMGIKGGLSLRLNPYKPREASPTTFGGA
jgi:cytochrome P450